MSFDQRAHAFIPDDTPEQPLPWLSTLDWYAAHGYEDPDPQDHAVWSLIGPEWTGTRYDGQVSVTWTGRLAQAGPELARLHVRYPGVRVWHVVGRARAPHADTALPDSTLDTRVTLREILAAAAGTDLDPVQLSGVANTVSTLLADGEALDDDNDVAAMVLETIARLAEAW